MSAFSASQHSIVEMEVRRARGMLSNLIKEVELKLKKMAQWPLKIQGRQFNRGRICANTCTGNELEK